MSMCYRSAHVITVQSTGLAEGGSSIRIIRREVAYQSTWQWGSESDLLSQSLIYVYACLLVMSLRTGRRVFVMSAKSSHVRRYS